MADTNPYIPSERAQDVESRTHINENEAIRRFAEKQAKLQRTVHEAVTPPAMEPSVENADATEDALAAVRLCSCAIPVRPVRVSAVPAASPFP